MKFFETCHLQTEPSNNIRFITYCVYMFCMMIRGIAMGIAAAGAGVGTLIWGPICHLIVTTYGWQVFYRVAAAFASFIGILVVPCLSEPTQPVCFGKLLCCGSSRRDTASEPNSIDAHVNESAHRTEETEEITLPVKSPTLHDEDKEESTAYASSSESVTKLAEGEFSSTKAPCALHKDTGSFSV